METEIQKKRSPVLGVLIIIIVLGLLFWLLKPTQQADAPTGSDVEVATTTEDIVEGETVVVSQDGIFDPTSRETQVIEGDGYVTTIRPVLTAPEPTGDAPEVVRFAVSAEEGETCRFSWEVEKAVECNFVNTQTRTGVTAVPVLSSLQIGARGVYQLECVGTGGKVTISEALTCS